VGLQEDMATLARHGTRSGVQRVEQRVHVVLQRAGVGEAGEAVCAVHTHRDNAIQHAITLAGEGNEADVFLDADDEGTVTTHIRGAQGTFLVVERVVRP
jgi:hypothetical protein